MSERATHISNWATRNRLRLNIVKTKAIVIGSYYYINQLPSMQTEGFTINQTLIKFETSVRNLGVILDSKLNWKEQVSSNCRKAYYLLYRLYFLRKSTTLNSRKHLFQTLLFPIVDFCSIVWCDLAAKLNQKLEVVMNAGIRHIYGLRKREHITSFRSSLQWITIEGKRSFAAILLYRMFATNKSHYLVKRYILQKIIFGKFLFCQIYVPLEFPATSHQRMQD